MAIIQEGNAVFYHPLDDLVEALESAAWDGTGIFNTGKVINALTPATGPAPAELSFVSALSTPFGVESEFLTASLNNVSIGRLSATAVVVAYADGGDLGHGKAKVGTVTGTTVTFGNTAEFNVGETDSISIAALSATKFVVAYRDEGDANHGTAKIGTVTGTAIVFGVESEFNSGSTDWISVTAMSATVFVVAYADGADSEHGTANVGTVSGTTITFGGQEEFAGVAVQSISIAALVVPFTISATKFVVTYRDDADNFFGKAKVGTVTGTTIAYGLPATFNGLGLSAFNSVTALSATKFVVAYRDNSSGKGKANVGTVSGTDITYGTTVEFLPVSGPFWVTVTSLSSTEVVVVYKDLEDLNHGTSKIGAVSGTDIVFGPETEFLTTDNDNSIGTALSSTVFAVAYRDVDDGGHGTVKIGTVTPVAYPTAVGATRLTFSAWTRRPAATLATTTSPPTTAPATTPPATTPAPTEAIFDTAGGFNFIVPAGVTSVGVVCIGAGGGGGAWGPTASNSPSGPFGSGGGGGALARIVARTVTPGQSIPIVVGTGGFPGLSGSGDLGTILNNGFNRVGSPGGNSTFDGAVLIGGGGQGGGQAAAAGAGGSPSGSGQQGGASGGVGGAEVGTQSNGGPGGGGGAGGYTGTGGTGGIGSGGTGTGGSGGAGGGGSGGAVFPVGLHLRNGGQGGDTGANGPGANGAAGTAPASSGPTQGEGKPGGSGSPGANEAGGGGGGGGYTLLSPGQPTGDYVGAGNTGSTGVVVITW